MSMTRILAATLAFALAAGVTQAQTPPVQTRPADQVDQLLSPAPTADNPPPANDGEAYHRAEDSEQTPEELRVTRALNDEVVSRNQLAENQEQADRTAFEAERIKHEEIVAAATRARLAYEEDVRRTNAAERDWQAEQARWQAENARWEADVRACRAGDRSRCAPPR